MGYYTNFKLTVLDDMDDVEIDSAIHNEWDNRDLYENTLSLQELIEDSCDSMKWYDHTVEMLEVSLRYPEYIFILDGDGEEAGDLWRHFYKNGKHYKWTPQIDRPSFDKTKLK